MLRCADGTGSAVASDPQNFKLNVGGGGCQWGRGGERRREGREGAVWERRKEEGGGRREREEGGGHAGCSGPCFSEEGGRRLTLVYISASWCAPCRKFSPRLSAFYKGKGASLSFELVFASLDKSEDAFSSYFSSMEAQFAVPFGRGEELASTLGVSGIPSLHVFCEGVLVTSKGVEGLMGSPDKFPWCWGGELVGRSVKIAGLEKAAHLNGKTGMCVGGASASERFTVLVEGETVALKREKITVV